MEFLPSAPSEEVMKGEENSSSIMKDISHTDAAPSAPPDEAPTFIHPVTQVELTLSARSLLNMDQVTHSDPLCIVFLLDSSTSGEWIELGRTETILNNLNPEWKTKFVMDYRFEEKQMLTFMIYDKDCAKFSLDNHDYLGKLECTMGEIISAPNSKFERSLKLPASLATSKCNSTLTITSEEFSDCKKYINFELSCKLVKGRAWRSQTPLSRKVFINISKQVTDGSWILLHRTDRVPVKDEDNISFPTISLRYSSVCYKGNLKRPLRFQLHQVTHSFRGKSAKLMGKCETSFTELTEKCQNGQLANWSIFPGNHKILELKQALGELKISQFVVQPQKTFVDYLLEGLEINFAVAIDFTASNGMPTNHSSLHYKHGDSGTAYVIALRVIGEVLEDYNSSKQFLAYGFGAKGFPLANKVNHKFPLNFKESSPLCDGIDGIISAYYRSLRRVKLYGPTCFAPIIREVTELAKKSNKDASSNKYFALLILTDGIVCDPKTTTEALVEASNAPLSVIIIGIGDEDFTAMEKFDADDKLLRSRRSEKNATRDIVQFVELRKFVNVKSIQPVSNGAKVALARSVLAELPQQVISWMKLNR